MSIANTLDWTDKVSTIEKIVANGVITAAISFAPHATFVADTLISTIDLSADTNTAASNTINVSAGTSTTAWTITGSTGVDIITGDGGADIITPGTGLDVITLSADSAVDTVLLATATDGGPTAGADSIGNTINSFESTSDKISLSGALATALDDITDNTALAFVTTGINDGATDALVAATLSATNEMLFLTNANSNLAAANLSDVSVVATALEAQITLTAASGKDGLIIVESKDEAGKFGMYYYLENGNIANQFDTAELTCLGIVDGDDVIATDFITT